MSSYRSLLQGLIQNPPVLPASPNAKLLGEQALDLVCSEVHWVHRRKESVTLLDSTTTRRQISIDFALPADIPPLARTRQGAGVQFAPLLLLRKAPRLLTRFDFRDDAGRALALPARAENGNVSGAMLNCLAERTLGHRPSAPVANELQAIALGDPAESHPLAEAFTSESADAERRQLTGDTTFSWLLWTLADSSVVTIPVIAGSGERKVVKLSYDVPVEDLDYPELGYRYGFRGYLGYFDLPFIGSNTYHFELQAPEGMEVLEAGFIDSADPKTLRVMKGPSHRVHFYTDDARRARDALAYVQLRVTGSGFLGGAAFASSLVAASVTACWVFAPELSQAATSTPSLLLLFPGILANYVARPGRHPVTSHLLSYARVVLIFSGGIALVAAARLSVISGKHPAAEGTLKWQFLVLGVIAWILAATLLVARSPWLPRRVSRQRSVRRSAQEAEATIEQLDERP
jgi:hypothetical protein